MPDDTVLLTRHFEQKRSPDVLVTPTGGAQGRLADLLAALASSSGVVSFNTRTGPVTLQGANVSALGFQTAAQVAASVAAGSGLALPLGFMFSGKPAAGAMLHLPMCTKDLSMALIDSEGFGWTTNAQDLLAYGAFVSRQYNFDIRTGGPLGDNYLVGRQRSKRRREHQAAAARSGARLFLWGAGQRAGRPPAGGLRRRERQQPDTCGPWDQRAAYGLLFRDAARDLARRVRAGDRMVLP